MRQGGSELPIGSLTIIEMPVGGMQDGRGMVEISEWVDDLVIVSLSTDISQIRAFDPPSLLIRSDVRQAYFHIIAESVAEVVKGNVSVSYGHRQIAIAELKVLPDEKYDGDTRGQQNVPGRGGPTTGFPIGSVKAVANTVARNGNLNGEAQVDPPVTLGKRVQLTVVPSHLATVEPTEVVVIDEITGTTGPYTLHAGDTPGRVEVRGRVGVETLTAAIVDIVDNPPPIPEPVGGGPVPDF